jgi:hypothetical protein
MRSTLRFEELGWLELRPEGILPGEVEQGRAPGGCPLGSYLTGIDSGGPRA